MANKNTRAYRKKNLSTTVIKGAQVPKAGNAMGNSLGVVEFPSGHQPSNRTSKWRGHGDPLGRKK